MSTKFEQLLDLIVNEEMDKANELFHEIVVEKSRDIYENLIAEEAEEDEEMDESAEEDDEEMDENVDLEDSYSMEDDEEDEMGGDATDEFGADIGDDDMDGEEGPEAGEDKAIFDIKNAIAELEAAFAELEQAQGSEMPHDEFGDEEMGGEDDDEDMMMGMHEGRRMTREYTEKVGNDWDKNSQKGQGQYVGAGSGDKDGAPVEGKSPISSGSGKPTSGANAKNLVQGSMEGSSNTGTSPAKGSKGINPESGEKFAKGMHNVDGAKSGVKTLSKQGDTKQQNPTGLNVGARTGENENQGERNTKSVVDRKIS
jgi:hypothetical protein